MEKLKPITAKIKNVMIKIKPVVTKIIKKFINLIKYLMNEIKVIGKNNKSIRAKIFFNIVSIVLMVVILIGTVSAYLSYRDTLSSIENSMINIAETSSNAIANKLEVYKTIAADLGLNWQISSSLVAKQVKDDIYKQIIRRYELYDIYTANSNGAAISNSTGKLNMVDTTSYFKASMNGATYITDPYYNMEAEKLLVIISAPLWKNGQFNSLVDGVLIVEVDAKVLSDMATSISVGQGGTGFILDSKAFTIAHADYSRVTERENTINNYKINGANKDLAALEEKMLNDELKFGEYTEGGTSMLLAHSSINGSNGWSMFVYSPKAQYLRNTYISIFVTVALGLLSIAAALLLGARVSGKIAQPIIACADRLKLLSQGDLHTEVPKTDNKDETSMLLESMESTVNELKDVINDISYHLGAISDGDFTTTVSKSYVGDLEPIESSVKKIIEYLNNVMGHIDESAEQVLTGSQQVAGGAMALSQGAEEQASSVEELAATISEISRQINQNAESSQSAKKITVDASQEVQNGSLQIEKMAAAMDEINHTSLEIGKIIKTIDDIAFQTNILALNAAIEAARAGEAGKGFAVVADEVRNLAAKSADAAKNTEELIQKSLKAVSKGVALADETVVSLKNIVDKTTETVSIVEEIAEATEHQATEVTQISAGVDQIASVVQVNSATAEESSAASEELSNQARRLKGLLDGIKIKNDSEEAVNL